MSRSALTIAALLLSSTISSAAAESDRYWPTWRGPTGNGVSPTGDPPVHWSETENVRWKIELPGLGSASPVVWRDRAFVLSAAPLDSAAARTQQQSIEQARERGERPPGPGPLEQTFLVTAISRRDGSILWQREAHTALPHEGHHPDNTWASGSPVTDGEVLIAHFGSQGTFAYDLDGNPLWQKDLGDMSTRRGFGEGTSPSIHGDRVIINWDHEGDSFIVALDKNTGEELWRRSRDEVTSWATPLILEVDGRAQAIVPATSRTRAYDVETGEEIWSLSGMTLNTIPSPVHKNGVVFLTSGFRGNMLQAVRLSGASGELEGTEHVLWTYDQDTPYVPSALLYGEQLYFIKRLDNILTSLAVDDGEILFNRVRLDELRNVWASPVGAAGRVYFVSREGGAMVLEHGPEYKVLAFNRLDDRFDATPAIVDGEIYLRGRRYLYCIASTDGGASAAER